MMPLCGVTKQRNSLICCNILTETSVKTHFHKRSGELDLLKAEQDFSFYLFIYFFRKRPRRCLHHHLHSPSVVSVSMLRLVSVRPQNEGITTPRSASSCAHDSSFSA